MSDAVIQSAAPSVTTVRTKGGSALTWLALGCVIALLFVLELAVGSVGISIPDVLAALGGSVASTPVVELIVNQFRLPRAINAAVSGAALGASGLMLQTVFRNPLADPYVLGIVFGARFGVALLVVVTGLAGNAYLYRFGLTGDIGIALASALGGLAVLTALIWLSRRVSTVTLLVAGLMLGYLCTGLVSVVLHLVDETQAQAFQTWNDGSFAGATHQQLRVAIPLLAAGLVYAAAQVKTLNVLMLGERYASSLGLRVERARLHLFACLALLVGTVTAFCGPIAFVGLVTAHLARLVFRTANHLVLMPAVILIGAALALGSDLITHLPWSRHLLHLNAVNGLLGAPLVLWALVSRRHARSLEL
jgi:iron complex transport system permease protein